VSCAAKAPGMADKAITARAMRIFLGFNMVAPERVVLISAR
jgi:hypothetical protein